MTLVDEKRLAQIEEDARRPIYWAEPATLTDLCETVRDLREALGVMLSHSPPEHWTGRLTWRQECQELFDKTGAPRP